MAYSDNPRKVYGKIEIVYSDEELSGEIETIESENSEISHPQEVCRIPSEPTVKACTMDGNANMDGSFQMLDDSCVCGWWSDMLSDETGVFTNQPYIEVLFVRRPVIYWRIIGDKKLHQYPVNFLVEYRRDGNVIKIEEITGNSDVEIVLEPKIEDINSIRLIILKWSCPNACAKILRCYERLYEVYSGDAVQSFEVGEELCSSEGNYNINSDTLTVTIYNENRKFDKGYLRSLMLLDRKLLPYLGIEKDGAVEYVPLGTFYSEEWNIAQDSQWVKCSATDRLMRLQNKTYVGLPLTEEVSLYEIAEDVLRKTGHGAGEYILSERLKTVILARAFLPKTAAWDALQEIANAGLCKVFADRGNRIVVSAEEDTAVPSGIEICPGNTFGYVSNISLTKFANSISVEYSEITVAEEIIEVASKEVQVGAWRTVVVTIDYTTEIAYAVAVSNNADVRITHFQSGVDACVCTLTNASAVRQTAVITITGNAIEIAAHTVRARDEESIAIYGEREYAHPASELVQSQEQAEYIASALLKKMRAGEGYITTTWRGDPALEIGRTYTCWDRFWDMQKLICEYNKFSYDGGLKQETRGRKI